MRLWREIDVSGRSGGEPGALAKGSARAPGRERVARKAWRGHQKLKAVKASLGPEIIAQQAETARADNLLIKLAAAELAIRVVAVYEQKLRESLRQHGSDSLAGSSASVRAVVDPDGEVDLVLDLSEQQVDRAAQQLEDLVLRFFESSGRRGADPWEQFAAEALAHAVVWAQEELEEELGAGGVRGLAEDWSLDGAGYRILREHGAAELRRFTRDYAQELAKEVAEKTLELHALSIDDLEKLLQLQSRSSGGGTRRLPDVPDIAPDGLVRITSDQVSYALVRAIHDAASGKDWTEGSEGEPTHTTITSKGRGAVHVSLRAPNTRLAPSPDVLPALWEQVRTLDDLTSDALLVCLAHWATRSNGPESPVWITADAILDARGIQRKRYRNEPGNWQHGHRTEDRTAAGRALAQLENIWVRLVDVEVIPRGRGRKQSQTIRVQSRALAMLDTITQEDLEGNPIFLGARVMPGKWAQEYWDLGLKWRGLLAQKALEYDPYREKVEKRLGKYLAFMFRWNAAGRSESVTLHVSTLLGESGLEASARNPQRTRDRLERALERLLQDGVIVHWQYLRDLRQLPSRGWLDDWLAMAIEIVPPAELREQYSRLARTN